jgi:hypothetical protein
MDEGAIPQIKEPSSKTNRDSRYVHLGLNMVYSLPHTSWNAHCVRKYAAETNQF